MIKEIKIADHIVDNS